MYHTKFLKILTQKITRNHEKNQISCITQPVFLNYLQFGVQIFFLKKQKNDFFASSFLQKKNADCKNESKITVIHEISQLKLFHENIDFE